MPRRVGCTECDFTSLTARCVQDHVSAKHLSAYVHSAGLHFCLICKDRFAEKILLLHHTQRRHRKRVLRGVKRNLEPESSSDEEELEEEEDPPSENSVVEVVEHDQEELEEGECTRGGGHNMDGVTEVSNSSSDYGDPDKENASSSQQEEKKQLPPVPEFDTDQLLSALRVATDLGTLLSLPAAGSGLPNDPMSLLKRVHDAKRPSSAVMKTSELPSVSQPAPTNPSNGLPFMPSQAKCTLRLKGEDPFFNFTLTTNLPVEPAEIDNRNAPKEDPPLPKLLRTGEDGTPTLLPSGASPSSLTATSTRPRRSVPNRRSAAHASDEWGTFSDASDEEGDESEPNWKHICEYCQKGFAKAYEFKKHVENVHKNKCRICGVTVGEKYKLRQHIKENHPGEKLRGQSVCSWGPIHKKKDDGSTPNNSTLIEDSMDGSVMEEEYEEEEVESGDAREPATQQQGPVPMEFQ